MAKKRKMTNQGKALFWSLIAIFVFVAPLAALAIKNSDKLLKTPETTLTFFSIALIVLFLVFAKKVIKALCKVLTAPFFGCLVGFLICLGLKALTSDLTLIFAAGLLGSALAWAPFQIAGLYNKCAEEDKANGNRVAGYTLKELLAKFFTFSVEEKEE